ncbi:MAG: glycosyltransferase, partial [Elusimicrobiales bacterium]|nr:glycosyltransferase [Elusimicrobiales bacterium]
MAPLISFITINYNSSHHTIDLVDSIIKRTSPACLYEIIVVDNASEAADYKALKDAMGRFPRVSVVRSRVNTGFSGGNMLGVNSARGQYYFFINNDCVLLNDCATILKEFIDSQKGAAAATAEITDEQGKVLSSGKLFPSVIKECLGNSAHRLIFSKRSPDRSAPTAVEVISGSCMFFRADRFCGIGGFDTAFFLYCE